MLSVPLNALVVSSKYDPERNKQHFFSGNRSIARIDTRFMVTRDLCSSINIYLRPKMAERQTWGIFTAILGKI